MLPLYPLVVLREENGPNSTTGFQIPVLRVLAKITINISSPYSTACRPRVPLVLMSCSKSFSCNSHVMSSDFEQWKSIMKEKEDCSFPKLTGYKRNPETGITVKYSQCNRGGSVKTKGEGSRRGKTQGN